MSEFDHELKTWPAPFNEVWYGRKVHEIRSTVDREFLVGDNILLREWHDRDKVYSGRSVEIEVTYVSHGGMWGLPKDLCVFSFRVMGHHERDFAITVVKRENDGGHGGA